MFKKVNGQLIGVPLMAPEGVGGAGGGTGSAAPELLKEIKSATDQLSKALEKQSEEIKQHGQTTDKTANQIKELEGNYEKLQKDLEAAKNSMNEMAVKFNRPGFGGAPEQVKTFGQQFTESEAYKSALTGNPTDMRTGLVNVKGGFFPAGQKDLTSATGALAGNAGHLVRAERMAGVITPLTQRLTIRDLLNASGTEANAIEYVEVTAVTNNAAPRAEGALAAQSELTFAVKQTAVKTISHYMVATNNILADAPELQNLIDTQLLAGLAIKEEQQLLYGDGTGENLTGFMVNTGTQDLGIMGATKNRLEHIRSALTKVRLAQLEATGIVLHPEDWEAIEMAKGSDGHYIWVSVNDGGIQRLFRVPVVDTTAIVKGEFLAGAFGQGAQLRDRQQAGIRIGEPNDFFLRGKKAVMAEERLALVNYRPQSFVKGSFATA